MSVVSTSGVVTSPEAQAAQAAHDAAMIAKAEGVSIVANDRGEGTVIAQRDPNAPSQTGKPEPKQDTPAGKTAKPEGVPDKFWNAEKGEVNYAAWAKSTSELEAKFTQQNQKPADGEQKPAEGEQKPADDVTKGLPADLVSKAEVEFAEKLEFSPETVEALVKTGVYTKQQIDVYQAGLRAQAQLVQTEIHQAAGGEDGWKQAASWASENYSDSELESLNTALASEKSADRIQAVQALTSRFRQNGNYEPARTITGQNHQPVGDFFRSQAEMVAAMGDPRYKADSAYRADVEGKLDRALQAGVNLFNGR